MEQVSDVQTSTRKIYKNNAIRVATFLGGPLVAGYLIAENFKAFDEPDKAKRTWIFAVITTALIFAVAFSLPATSSSGEYLVPLLYAWAAYYLVQRYQGTNITSHLNAGGETYSWGRTLLIALIGCVITFGAFLIIYVAVA